MTFASNHSVKTMKRIRPRVLIVDIAFTEYRFQCGGRPESAPAHPRCGR
ncbi:hypothetical protein QF035_010501 [Streptomyces umbrinus]|uniref:Uncharacterized protein n=1 Tax=Streptomyces umbrinus TaxID=67370 RepID=A0ABU0TDN1_9ACTN|nr:hypothetical protein [Streptomyces umbrinus]